MSSPHTATEELHVPKAAAANRRLLESSDALLGLIALSEQAEAELHKDISLHGVISRGVLKKLLSALHYRDVAAVHHSRNVALLATGMANYLGWEEQQVRILEIASLLHDIGKIGVPETILFKPGRLNGEEAELMALHYEIGIDLLQACRVNSEVLEIIVQSYAYSKMTGDSNQLKGSKVHQGARILAVADAYDSLRTDQVYRDGKSHVEIMQILNDCTGTQFDSNIVHALKSWHDKEGLPFPPAGFEKAQSASLSKPKNPAEALEACRISQIFFYLYVLESLYDGFYIVDAEKRILVWNRGMDRLFGKTHREMLHTNWSSEAIGYVNGAGKPLLEQETAMYRALADEHALNVNSEIINADGQPIRVELQTVPLFNAAGELQGALEIVRNQSGTTRRPQEYIELKKAASKDPLTNVANRGELETQLTVLATKYVASGYRDPYSVIFMDIDCFKPINDTYGHAAGDNVLVGVAQLAVKEMFSGETVGRYGGEEFVVLCPHTDLETAIRKAERLRIALSETVFEDLNGQFVTASMGVAQAEPGDSVESVVKRADKALYEAKESGRNRTCSLTREQITQAEQQAKLAEQEPEEVDPFLYKGSFIACVDADMVVYKLGGYVDDTKANLVEVLTKEVIIHVGKQGLLPYWGRSPHSQPVELKIILGDIKNQNGLNNNVTSQKVKINVCIRPLGWIKDSQVFQARANRVMSDLKSYFVAD